MTAAAPLALDTSPAPLRVLGIDPSLTATGLALPTGATLRIQPGDTRRGTLRLRWIRAQVTTHITEHRPDVAAIEGFSHGSAYNSHALGGVGWLIRVLLDDLGVPWTEITPAQLHLYATGKGNARKDAVLTAAVRRLPTFTGNTNDEADAAWLQAMTLDHYGHPPAPMPAAHRAALTKVDWPLIGATR